MDVIINRGKQKKKSFNTRTTSSHKYHRPKSMKLSGNGCTRGRDHPKDLMPIIQNRSLGDTCTSMAKQPIQCLPLLREYLHINGLSSLRSTEPQTELPDTGSAVLPTFHMTTNASPLHPCSLRT